MSLSPHEYIRHIIDEIDYILSQISGTDFDSFLRDGTLKRAFLPWIADQFERVALPPAQPAAEGTGEGADGNIQDGGHTALKGAQEGRPHLLRLAYIFSVSAEGFGNLMVLPGFEV